MPLCWMLLWLAQILLSQSVTFSPLWSLLLIRQFDLSVEQTPNMWWSKALINALTYVIVNFFVSDNFYLSFVSTLFADITIPKQKRKTKIIRDKKLTTTYTILTEINMYIKNAPVSKKKSREHSNPYSTQISRI